MNYGDIDIPVLPHKAADIRKALAPLIEKYPTDDLIKSIVTDSLAGQARVSQQQIDDRTEEVKNEVVQVLASVEAVSKQVADIKEPDLGVIVKAIDTSFDVQIAKSEHLSKVQDEQYGELKKAFAMVYKEVVKPSPRLTDHTQPQDYINVRLTDGKQFYKALDQFVTSISDGISPYQDSSTVTAYTDLGTATNSAGDILVKTTASYCFSGNIGVGTITPNANSILDLTSTTRAFMPPRMTTTQRDAIVSPTAGMMVYNSTTNKLNVYTTAWEAVTSA